MRIVTYLILAFATAATASPSLAQQTMLDQLLGKIVHPRTGTAANGTTLPANSAASITPAQAATMQRLLAAPLTDQRVAADRATAAPLITKLLTIGACARSSAAWNAINRDSLTPRTYQPPFSNELVAMDNLTYHDKNSCLDVARLTDWSKPALNALKFRVYYIAPDSGEAKSQWFEVQKTSEGVWMVRGIGVALT